MLPALLLLARLTFDDGLRYPGKDERPSTGALPDAGDRVRQLARFVAFLSLSFSGINPGFQLQ